MTRLQVVHTTRIRYATAAGASYNEVRMRPATIPGQMVLTTGLRVDQATWSHVYRDYWGTHVTAFEVLRAHRELTVTSESILDIATVPEPAVTVLDWDAYATPQVTDRLAEYVAMTPRTEPPDEVGALALAQAGGRSPADAARRVCDAVRDGLDYVPGVTGVHTRAIQAWQQRQGVCQDIAHLALGGLRSLGIPARYVSGYLHPLGHEAVPGETFVGESHAWIEFWSGRWVGIDPTNRCEVGDHHVVVGRGRDYDDVTPLRGVVAGGGESTQDVRVELTLLSA